MGQNCHCCFSNKQNGPEDLRDTKSANASTNSLQTQDFRGTKKAAKRSKFARGVPQAQMYSDEKSRPGTATYTISDGPDQVSMDSFKLLKVIGRGSFGKVYLVQKRDSREYFAMKTLKKDMILRRQQKQNTQAERLILEKITNPFIVKLHYAFQTGEKLYFVIDFLNGGELFYHLRREQRFTEERSKFYAAEILLALECLHENGVIYRDLKPENVLLD